MVRGGRKNGAEEALVVVRIEDFFNEDTSCVIIVQEKPLHFKQNPLPKRSCFSSGFAYCFQIKNSSTSTIPQQAQATWKRLAPFQAVMIPMANAAAPASGEAVAVRIAGKVMTARVTYGTY